MIKWKKIRLAGHVARIGKGRVVYRVLVGKSEGKNHLENPHVDRRIILTWIFRKWDGGGHRLD